MPLINRSILRSARINVRFNIPSASPPPAMIYAVAADGSYYTQDASYTGDNIDYLLEVPPGSYQVYARATNPGDYSYYGTWLQNQGLAIFEAPNNGAVDVVLTTPPTPCDPTYWLPTSPDGRFPATGDVQQEIGCIKPTPVPTDTPRPTIPGT
ncbi:MAG: hypothetical protein ACK2U1_22580, partial [Anaerolineales bacterium]